MSGSSTDSRELQTVWVRQCSVPTKPSVAYGDDLALERQEIKKGGRFQKAAISISLSHQTPLPNFGSTRAVEAVRVHGEAPQKGNVLSVKKVSLLLTAAWPLPLALFTFLPHPVLNHLHGCAPRGHRSTEQGQEQVAGAEWELPKIVLMK